MRDGAVPGRRIPSLDGMRAVAIALVIAGHAGETAAPEGGGPHWRRAAQAVLGNSKFGVEVFFVLSGFLITSLMLAERARAGSIDLRSFYARRAFRIVPAYYAYILAIAALWWIGLVPARPTDFFYAATFTWIYNFGDWNWYLGHSWSLSVEEQFYLAWPVALILLGQRLAARLAVASLAAVPLAGYGLSMLGRGVAHRACYVIASSHADVLMAGCLAALWWDEVPFRAVIRRLVALRLAPAILLVALVGSAAAWSTGGPLVPLVAPVNGVAIALALSCLVTDPGGLLGRALNSRPVARVGVMSYSLYLWQQLFIPPDPAWAIQALPLNLLAAAVAASASYHLIELPALRLRKRLSAGRPA